ncbi:MAG: D-2-hydroxyacid dehydrogenase [Bacillota bacterium]|nr:D-2-hydroxyacid dehydrogenase [Bacillota bacterium]
MVFTDAATVSNGDVSLSSFSQLGEVVTYPLLKADEVAAAISDAEAVICNKTPMCEDTLKNARALKYIGVLATGYNNVDIPYVTSRGITVCNAGSYSTNSVAQHVFALILQIYNGVGVLDDYSQAGGWQKAESFSPLVYPLRELQGKTLGIVGYGSIGREVAKIALAFGMRVIAYNRSPKQEENVEFMEFSQVLAEADIITVHCPLNDESALLFNEATFGQCKDGAVFINTARGGIVDEPSLAAALKSRKLSAAAVDVLTIEPMTPDCCLPGVPNLIITPHVAWTPLETRERLLAVTAENLRSYIEGKPQNKVN